MSQFELKNDTQGYVTIQDVWGSYHRKPVEIYSYAWKSGPNYVLEFSDGDHITVSPEIYNSLRAS